MSPKKNKIRLLATSAILGFLFFVLIKTFVLDVVKINSSSMLPLLKKGHIAWVRPLHFLYNKIYKNDIVWVRINDTDAVSCFKQVVATGGDTLWIDSAFIYVNNQKTDINPFLLRNYVLKFKQQKDTVLFEQEKFEDRYLVDDSCAYLVAATSKKIRALQGKNLMIEQQIEKNNTYDENTYAHHPKIKWNKDFFGKLYIPKTGDTLRFDSVSVFLYQQLIKNENNTLDLKNGKIYINQEETNHYVVKENYFFVVGTNFSNSIDSRQFGLVPKKNIQAVYWKKG
ncbi:MAG: signal peptidase I [Bacteroidetes bacterium]|nr:signal peptidase I [Bacteroidota bacterium]